MRVCADAGLPAGLQLLARPFDEATLFRVAYAYEQVNRHRSPPPLFKECVDPPEIERSAGAQAAG